MRTIGTIVMWLSILGILAVIIHGILSIPEGESVYDTYARECRQLGGLPSWGDLGPNNCAFPPK